MTYSLTLKSETNSLITPEEFDNNLKYLQEISNKFSGSLALSTVLNFTNGILTRI